MFISVCYEIVYLVTGPFRFSHFKLSILSCSVLIFVYNKIYLLSCHLSKGAFTNDVIIFGGGVLGKMTEDEWGVGLKMTSLFLI